jgi:hypothetical protein
LEALVPVQELHNEIEGRHFREHPESDPCSGTLKDLEIDRIRRELTKTAIRYGNQLGEEFADPLGEIEALLYQFAKDDFSRASYLPASENNRCAIIRVLDDAKAFRYLYYLYDSCKAIAG